MQTAALKERPEHKLVLYWTGYRRWEEQGMDITYSIRSQFLDTCEAAIREHKTDLADGGTVDVKLSESGYNGCVIVTVRQDDQVSFGTDWTASDPTRFPARIKAAATALRNCGCEGTFEVSHVSGSLAVRPASVQAVRKV